ncbi:unnamed protein product [Ambrosiozyma monospora]|uniref:Unnamed protein product n=1 Tax=Ambrosiozyma monospora TaxID=43982 RepID=A0ACB5SRA0_AMBMO|nr:unnamed protein product [Ambrosiozyma monospora]
MFKSNQETTKPGNDVSGTKENNQKNQSKLAQELKRFSDSLKRGGKEDEETQCKKAKNCCSKKSNSDSQQKKQTKSKGATDLTPEQKLARRRKLEQQKFLSEPFHCSEPDIYSMRVVSRSYDKSSRSRFIQADQPLTFSIAKRRPVNRPMSSLSRCQRKIF